MKSLAKQNKPTKKSKTLRLTLTGLGVSTGIAIGKACLKSRTDLFIPEYEIDHDDIAIEWRRLNEAAEFSKKQIHKLKNRSRCLPDVAAKELGYLLDAHLAMLSDSFLLRGVESRIAQEHINAEAAVSYEINSITKQFIDIDESFLANSVDEVEEVGKRLIRNLTNAPQPKIDTQESDLIIIANELTPAEAALLNKKQVIGFATRTGGAEGHTAIMARSLSLPAVLGVDELINHISDGDDIILDGKLGYVIINPEPDVLKQYQDLQSQISKSKKKLTWLRKIPAMTKDNKRVTLQANMELPKEMSRIRYHGAEGIGLLRSEFLFMNRKSLPSEEEQFHVFKNIVEGMKGRPVTIRTFDADGEKVLPYLNKNKKEKPKNPALGLRAVRLMLQEEELFKDQLSALLRASAYGPLQILIPMIATAREFRQVKKIYKELITQFKKDKIEISNPAPKLGIMIEIPSAALVVDLLAKECDFLSIGTNDLTMYTLAIDRSDAEVAYLYNSLHPSVLQLVKKVIDAGKTNSIPVSICGEVAGDPHYTGLLLGLGLTNLSMSPTNLTAVKHCVRHIHTADAKKFATKVLNTLDAHQVQKQIEDFNKKIRLTELY